MSSTKRRARLNLSPPPSPTSPPHPKRHHRHTPHPRSPAPPAPSPTAVAAADDGADDDDYMSMPLPEPAQPGPESYSARLKRKLRAQELAQPMSKSELAALERAKREAGLSRSLLEAAASGEGESKGLKMMRMMGFTPGAGLGSEKNPGRLEPLGVKIRTHRSGIGLEGEGNGNEEQKKGKERAAGVAVAAVAAVDPGEYRERVRMERQRERLEAQLRAAQKVCEKFDDGAGEAGTKSVPLEAVNVLWRGLVKEREERDREARRKHDLLQNIDTPRLPGYHRDRELDLEDKIALGIAPENFRKLGTMVVEETEDDVSDDEELREFQELEVAERLERVVGYLRSGYKYCFWCKYRYPDEDMDGCPGVSEDLHG